MKILYLHQYFNTPEMPGSTRSYEFSKRLCDNGHKVFMVTSNWQKKSSNRFENIDGINVFWSPVSYSNKMGFFRRLISFSLYIFYALKFSRKLKFDLIIASSTPLTIGVPAIILKKLKKANLVFEVRDMWPQLPIAIGFLKSKFLIYLAEKLEKYIYNNSDSIIALSEGMKNEILKINQNKKISVITNFCDIDSFCVDKKIGVNFRKKFLKINNEPLIVYAGSLGRINNVKYLIHIALKFKKNNSNAKFLIVGNGYQKEPIIKKAIELDLYKKNVFLADYYPKKQMPMILSSATIICSLFADVSAMENNSANKFFDGLAAGKPLMLNYGGWQSDLLAKHEAGFNIPKNNPDGAYEIIKKVINDKIIIQKMSNNSKKLSKHFTLDSNYMKFQSVINQNIK